MSETQADYTLAIREFIVSGTSVWERNNTGFQLVATFSVGAGTIPEIVEAERKAHILADTLRSRENF